MVVNYGSKWKLSHVRYGAAELRYSLVTLFVQGKTLWRVSRGGGYLVTGNASYDISPAAPHLVFLGQSGRSPCANAKSKCPEFGLETQFSNWTLYDFTERTYIWKGSSFW